MNEPLIIVVIGNSFIHYMYQGHRTVEPLYYMVMLQGSANLVHKVLYSTLIYTLYILSPPALGIMQLLM